MPGKGSFRCRRPPSADDPSCEPVLSPAAAWSRWPWPPACPRPVSRRGRSPRPGAPAAAALPSATPPSPDGHASHQPAASQSPGASASAVPVDHDAAALAVVKRFLDGEGATLEGAGNKPLAPVRTESGVKVFELTIDQIQHRIDASRIRSRPSATTGRGRVRGSTSSKATGSGRSSRTTWTSRPASTSTASACRTTWTASRTSPRTRSSPVTRSPMSSTRGPPARTCTTRITTRPTRSGAVSSGAFIVQPKDPADRYDRKYGATQDIVWISNDSLGGFTINGRGFPATSPIVAKLGETIVDPVHERGRR